MCDVTLLLLLLIIILACGYVYAKFRKSFAYWQTRNVPFVPPSFPFGNMGDVMTRQKCMGDKICEVYNVLKARNCKYGGLYFFNRKSFLAIDPQLIKSILSTDFRHFHDRGIFYDEINDPLSAHLFSLSGDKWKRLRTKLTAAFTGGKIRYVFPCIEQCALEMIDVIESTRDDTIEIKDLLARYTTDVIGSAAFGLRCASLRDATTEFRRMGKRAFTQTPWDTFKMIVMRARPDLARTLRLSVFARDVSQFFRNVVERTIEYRQTNGVTRNDFLQLLIQLKSDDDDDDEERLTTEEIVAQAFIFFLAGFETTSTAMSFALLELAVNADVQAKARDETLNTLKKHDGKVSYDCISELHYLDRIMCESMRKYPPAPVYLRKCTTDYKVPETDVIVEKGLSVLIPALALHRDPDYFPEPLAFDPDRFNERNKKKIRDYTYIPFGGGPRICIGMRFAMVQAKLALMAILKNYKFTLNKRTPFPLVMATNGLVYTTKEGIWLDFEKYSP